MAHNPTTQTNDWLRRSFADIRVAFVEDPADRPIFASSTRRKTQQSPRDVVELAVISVALCAAGLAAVWSTTL